MEHLPPGGLSDLVTKDDLTRGLSSLGNELRAEMERLARRLIMWTSSMVLATGGLAFAAGRFI
jgi:hypothetical protein